MSFAREALQLETWTDSETKSGRGFRVRDLRNLLYTLPFLALYFVQLAHHQLWRDELNAYGIAVASPNLKTLFHIVHYEGHPWLWYVVLWVVSRITPDPVGLKAVQGIIGAAIYLILGMASPFRWREKTLLLLSYFVCFEYTVIARMYGLVLLLALLYLWQVSRGRRQSLFSFVLLGLMASADMIGIMLSIALLIEMTVRVTPFRPARAGDTAGTRRSFLVGLAIYAGFLLLAVASLWPARDISQHTAGQMLTSAKDMRHLWDAALNYTVKPYFPMNRLSFQHYWKALDKEHHGPKFGLALPFIAGALWFTFRRHRNLLLMVGSTILMATGFAHLVYMGGPRHFGIAFVAFMAGIWMIAAAGETLAVPAYVLLLLSAAAGIQAEIGAWRVPFSNAQATAGWLQKAGLAGLPIAGTPDTSVASIAELLHRPVYMLDCNCSRSFLLFSNQRDSFLDDEVPERLVMARKALNAAHLIYISATPLTPEIAARIEAGGISITPLKQFTGAEAPDEDYYVYRMDSSS